MHIRNHRRDVIGLALLGVVLTGVGAPPAAATEPAGAHQAGAAAPAVVTSGVLPKYRAKYRAIIDTLSSPMWSSNQAWFAEVVRYGDQLAGSMATAQAIPGGAGSPLVDQYQKRAAEWGMELFATTDVEMPLDVARIEKFAATCRKYVRNQDDREFITFEFGRLRLAQETQLILTVGGDVTKMSQALANGDVAGYHQAAATAEQDWATANRTFTQTVRLLRKFG